MAESRNIVEQRTQLGVEATQGTSVAANRIIEALTDFSFNQKRPVTRKRTRGRKWYTHQTRGKEWGEGKLGGDLCFNGLLYLCAGILPVPTPVQIGTSGVYTWVFTPQLVAKDNPKTFTGEIGDDTTGDRYANLQLTALDVKLGQEEATMESPFFAQKPSRNVSMTASPTRIEARAVDRSMVNVYLTNNFSNHGLSAALLADADSESFHIGEKFKPRWVHDRSTARGFKSRSEIGTEATFDIVSEYNAQARGWSTNQDADDLMYFKLDIQGEQAGLNVATPVYESIAIEAQGKFDESSDEGDNEGSWAYRYPFCALDHATGQLGVPFKITIQSKLSAL